MIPCVVGRVAAGDAAVTFYDPTTSTMLCCCWCRLLSSIGYFKHGVQSSWRWCNETLNPGLKVVCRCFVFSLPYQVLASMVGRAVAGGAAVTLNPTDSPSTFRVTYQTTRYSPSNHSMLTACRSLCPPFPSGFPRHGGQSSCWRCCSQKGVP